MLEKEIAYGVGNLFLGLRKACKKFTGEELKEILSENPTNLSMMIDDLPEKDQSSVLKLLSSGLKSLDAGCHNMCEAVRELNNPLLNNIVLNSEFPGNKVNKKGQEIKF